MHPLNSSQENIQLITVVIDTREGSFWDTKDHIFSLATVSSEKIINQGKQITFKLKQPHPIAESTYW